MVANNEWYMYWWRDLGNRLVPLSFYIWGLSFKTNLFNCEADPLKRSLNNFPLCPSFALLRAIFKTNLFNCEADPLSWIYWYIMITSFFKITSWNKKPTWTSNTITLRNHYFFIIPKSEKYPLTSWVWACSKEQRFLKLPSWNRVLLKAEIRYPSLQHCLSLDLSRRYIHNKKNSNYFEFTYIVIM